MHFHTIAIISLGSLLLSTSALAGNRPPVPGSYRPTDGNQVPNTSGNHQQFIPANPGAAGYPATAPAQGYAPPGYWNNNAPASAPSFNVNPGNIMNNMFGGNNNLPYGYPGMTAPARVAPVYDPPIPGAAPSWNYGAQPTYTQPAYTQPAAPAYNTAQPGNPAANGYTPPANTYTGSTTISQPPPVSSAPPPLEPTPSGQGHSSLNIKAAPRPFSNPQEAGQAFVQRNNSVRTTYGGNDSRFRPPELEGTP
ncbi:hypothetical protein [Thiolapillus brandeum]|uniref:Uncharacterized protein n=1 Tax=Thiolapillus brandeum TaxID=1076588 RepID=A0A7U6JIH0_9GAMM|nr:hypothetical protein [Thiolapillus brandeum]BAO45291.1 hypothetical protein TBH_C2381 [Thiolapillus brandeum]